MTAQVSRRHPHDNGAVRVARMPKGSRLSEIMIPDLFCQRKFPIVQNKILKSADLSVFKFAEPEG